MPLSDKIDKIWVISLLRTPKRLQGFFLKYPESMPKPEVWPGFDAKEVPPPHHWMRSAVEGVADGAFGCQRSWLGILDHAIANNYTKPILVFEDDAEIIAPEKVEPYFDLLPNDWSIAYLGCQHLSDPVIIRPGLCHVTAADRTHALFIHPSFFRELRSLWGSERRHVDWCLRDYAKKYKFYAPDPNIAIQGDNESIIMGRDDKARSWNARNGAGHRNAPVLYLECPKDIFLKLRSEGWVHGGYTVNPQTQVDFALENILNIVTGNLKPLGGSDLKERSIRQFSEMVKMEAEQMPRAAAVLWCGEKWDLKDVPDFPLVSGNTYEEALSGIKDHVDLNPTVKDLTFVHSGDVGDIIYSLPAIRATGGGKLILYPQTFTSRRMTPKIADELKGLLEKQWYIRSVSYDEGVPKNAIDLSKWRRVGGPGKNIAEWSLTALGMDPLQCQDPWIEVEPKRVSKIIVHRSQRYHGGMDWREIEDWKSAMYLGFPDEHAEFVGKYGEMPLITPKDFLETAQIISGSELFIGNQSSPLSIAIAMGHKCIVETCPQCDNCRFERNNLEYR